MARLGNNSARLKNSAKSASVIARDSAAHSLRMGIGSAAISNDDAITNGEKHSLYAISPEQVAKNHESEVTSMRLKVACTIVLVVVLTLTYCSINVADNAAIHGDDTFPLIIALKTLGVLFVNLIANVIPFISAISTSVVSDMPASSSAVMGSVYYNGVIDVLQIEGITILCAVLLSVSGMLYQNVFKNPIAGPGMLGVSSGVSLGMVLIVAIYGSIGLYYVEIRYLFCYGFGALILLFVILAGKKLSGKGRPYDIMTMLLLGSVLSQFIGVIITFVTMYVMDVNDYSTYLTLSQMLIVDTSAISWIALGIVCVITFVPVYLLRFRFNALAFDEQEVRLMGINMTVLRGLALVLGALMILAAQIHIGAVAMVSLIVPFLSRAWFGCEFRKQLIGNVCISIVFMLICRQIAYLIPFVGDGIGIGSIVSFASLPVFIFIVAKRLRAWN